MSGIIRIDSASEIGPIAAELREELRPLSVGEPIDRLVSIGDALDDPDLADIDGLPFLRLWLRASTLQQLVQLEFGTGALDDNSTIKHFYPLGVIAHWPAANVPIQPLLSLSCALLGENASLIRVPSGLVESMERVLSSLHSRLGEKCFEMARFVSFPSEREELHSAMACEADGAMVWGSADAITAIRKLPFPSHAQVAVFGPRISAAAIDSEVLDDSQQLIRLCRYIARDLWQFDQQACSSPHCLFVEVNTMDELWEFAEALRTEVVRENELHPRLELSPSISNDITKARAGWILSEESNRALYPVTPDWTLLLGDYDKLKVVPESVFGKTLYVMKTSSLEEAIGTLPRFIQTLGLQVSGSHRRAELSNAAFQRGIDHVVKIGQMHLMNSPWDGQDLVRTMVRKVRSIPEEE